MQSERKELDILKSLEVFGTHRSNVSYEFSTFLFSSKTEKFLSQVIIIGRSNVIWDHSNNLICLPCGPALRGVFMSDEHRGVTRKKVTPACDDYTSAAAFISFFTRSGMEVLDRREANKQHLKAVSSKTHTRSIRSYYITSSKISQLLSWLWLPSPLLILQMLLAKVTEV